jgi:hypothetical protein
MMVVNVKASADWGVRNNWNTHQDGHQSYLPTDYNSLDKNCELDFRKRHTHILNVKDTECQVTARKSHN